MNQKFQNNHFRSELLNLVHYKKITKLKTKFLIQTKILWIPTFAVTKDMSKVTKNEFDENLNWTEKQMNFFKHKFDEKNKNGSRNARRVLVEP